MRIGRVAFLVLGVVAFSQACGGSGGDTSIPSEPATDASASTDTSTGTDANGGKDALVSDAPAPSDGSPTTDGNTTSESGTDAGTTTEGGSDGATVDTGVDANVTDANGTVDANDAAACQPPAFKRDAGCTRPLVLYRGGSVTGAIGGRSGADALCDSARVGHSFGSANTVAFISVGSGDAIADLPENYGFATDVPIVGPTGIEIAASWSDLLDGQIEHTLKEAAVLETAQAFWYSGSDKSGSDTSNNCSGWTDGSTLFDADYGVNNATDEGWIHQNGQATCGLLTYSVLCIGY